MREYTSILNEWIRPLRKVKEFQEIAKVEDIEFIRFYGLCEKALLNMFIATMNEDAISRMEKIVGIIPEETDTLELRRMKLQDKFCDFLPYTDKTLDDRLTALCGEDGYEITRNYKEYELIITTKLDNGGIFEAVIGTLDVIIPCNLVVTYQNYIDVKSPLTLYSGGVSKVAEIIS